MYTRKLYLERIAPFVGKPVVKVITGMRRVGKSYLLRQLMEQFASDGVPSRNVLYVDKESLDFEHVRTYSDLHALAMESLVPRRGPEVPSGR